MSTEQINFTKVKEQVAQLVDMHHAMKHPNYDHCDDNTHTQYVALRQTVAETLMPLFLDLNYAEISSTLMFILWTKGEVSSIDTLELNGDNSGFQFSKKEE